MLSSRYGATESSADFGWLDAVWGAVIPGTRAVMIPYPDRLN